MSAGQYAKNNTVLGDDAMADALDPSASSGYDNTAYGYNVLKNLADKVNENSGFGSQALESAFSGENSAFGAYAGAEIGSGSENALFGNWAGRFVGGKSNTAHGYKALAGDKGTDKIPGPLFATGGFNTAVGNRAMRYYPNGDDNVAVGYSALVAINNGDNNTAIGSGAGSSITTGNNNTFIGKGADASGLNPGNAQQRTAIGAGALADTDNTIILGTSENVGIGTTVPDSRLHVQIDPAAPPQTAIHGIGIPGILAEGSVSTAYAIHAKGSSEAPAIYVEGGTGSGVPAPGAPAIYAKGPGGYPAIFAEATGGANAIYAQGSATDPAIHARGTDATVGLFAEGSPGILAQKLGSSQEPAIYAIGSEEGYAIQAMTSGTVAAIHAEGNNLAPAIHAMGSGSSPVIHAQGTGSGPTIFAEKTGSGTVIQSNGTIKANGPATGSASAILATATGTGHAILAQSTSTAAIYAVGSPGIDAVGSATNPAIRAVGSIGAPGIRAEASGSASSTTDAAAIYAEGSASHAIYAVTNTTVPPIYAESIIGTTGSAIYAKTNGSAPAIEANGLAAPGPALFVDGGFRVKVRLLNIASVNVAEYPIYPDDYIIILLGQGGSTIAATSVTLVLPGPPTYQPQDGQMFIIKSWAGIGSLYVKTVGGCTILQNNAENGITTSRRLTDTSNIGYHGGVTYMFSSFNAVGLNGNNSPTYYEMVSMPYNI
jgi:hypothetical protein